MMISTVARRILARTCVMGGMALGAVSPALSATVLMYGDMTSDSTDQKRLTQQQFDSHLAVFDSGTVTFLPLDTIMSSLEKSDQLGISFSGAYKGAYDIAMLPLLQRNIPFTVFVSPTRVGSAGYLSWEQLQDLHAQGVTLAVNPITMGALPKLSDERIRTVLQNTKSTFFDKMGFNPKYVSHPYGISSARVNMLFKEAGFLAGFGQHSGAFNSQTNRYNLPRFGLSRRYGSEGRLQQSMRTESMPVTDFLPTDPYLTAEQNPPALGFTFDKPVKVKSALSCFHSQLGPIKDVQWLGNRRVEIRFAKPFRAGSSRINCTMPKPTGKKWYWLGQQFYVPKDAVRAE